VIVVVLEPRFRDCGGSEDGRMAIQCVEKYKPDLILKDLSMPRMNGMDAIREIKKRFAEKKILVLTVHKTEEYILATPDR
jgi:DNA-binding NarL/FixJ family response regulator